MIGLLSFRKSIILLPILILILLINPLFTNAQTFNSYIIDDISNTDYGLSGRVYINSAVNPKIQLSLANGSVKSYPINMVSQYGTFFIPDQDLAIQKSYEFRFIDGSTIFPELDWFDNYVPNNYSNYKSDLTLYSYNETSSTAYCKPFSEDYTCGFEHYQAYEISRFAKIFYDTTNQTYSDIMFSLINSSWANGVDDNYCNPINHDFNCGPVNDIDFLIVYTGASRQATIINELWLAYSYTADSFLKSLALNFTEGSASECDVWASDFDCGNSHDQGLMIQAYSQAYKNTLNSDYLTIVNNLIQNADFSNLDSDLVLGLLYARPFTELDIDSLISSSILNISILPIPVSETEVLSNQLLFANALQYNFFENETLSEDIPLSYYIHRKIYDLLSSNETSCSHNNQDYSCLNPEIQSKQIKLFNYLEYRLPKTQSGFFDLRYDSPSIGDPINLSIKYLGEIDEPKIFIRNNLYPLQNFNNYSLINGTYSITGDYVLTSGFLEVYFANSSGDMRYPEMNDFILAIPLESPVLDTYEQLRFTNPLYLCQPFSITPSFDCYFEYMQGIFLEGVSGLYEDFSNQTYLSAMNSLVTEEMDFINIFSTCDPNSGDFTCTDYDLDPFIPFPKSGVYRASSLAKAYLEVYKLTNRPSLLRNAELLLNQDWEDCSLINGDYNCGPKNQGSILQSVSLLYSITGYAKYKTWLENLLLENTFNTTQDILGAISSFTFTNSATIESDINSSFKTIIEPCTSNQACNITDFYQAIRASWNAYNLFTTNYYFDLGSDLLRSSPKSSLYCMPLTELYSENYICQYPDEQGIVLSAIKSVNDNYVITDIPDLNLSISGNNIGSLNELKEYNCTITNIGNFTLSRASIGLATNQKFYSPSTSLIEITNLDIGEAQTVSYVLNLSTGGRSFARCQLFNYEDSILMNVTNIGDIISVSTDSVVNVFSNNILQVSLQNIHSFVLENFSVDVNLFSTLNDNISLYNTSFNKSFLQSNEIISFNHSLVGFQEGTYKIIINATSEFGGESNSETFFTYVFDSLPISLNYNFSNLLYDSSTVFINVSNNKSFNLDNLFFNITNKNSFFMNGTTSLNFNLSSNESLLLNFTIYHNRSDNIFPSYSFYSPQGISSIGNISFNISSDLLDFTLQNYSAIIDNEFYLPILVKNLASKNQTNILLNFNNNSGIDLLNATIIDDFTQTNNKHSIKSSTLSYNVSELISNISVLENNISINTVETNNFSIQLNNSKTIISSVLHIVYSYSGDNTSIKTLENGIYTNTSCMLTTAINRDVSCNISLNSEYVDLIFNINNSSNLIISLIEINNTVKYLQNRFSFSNTSGILDFLEPNEEVNLSLSLIMSSNTGLFNITYVTSENALGLLLASLEADNPEIISSSRGGSGSYFEDNVTSNITFNINNNEGYRNFNELDSFETIFKDFFSLRNISELNYSQSKQKSVCVNTTKVYDEQSNKITLYLKNICNNNIKDIYIYESFNISVVESSNKFTYNILSEGTIFYVPLIYNNETINISYTLKPNQTLDEKYLKSLFIHIQSPDIITLSDNINETFFSENNDSIKNKTIDFHNFFNNSVLVIYNYKLLIIGFILLVLLTILIYRHPYKYLLEYYKSKKILRKAIIHHHKRKKISDKKTLYYDLNMKINYLDYLLKNEELDQSKSIFIDVIKLFDNKIKNPSPISSAEDTESLYFLKSRLLDSYKTYQSIKNGSLSDKIEDYSKDSLFTSSKINKNDSSVSKDEHNIFLQIMKLEYLIKDKKYDVANKKIHTLEQHIDALDELEKQNERDFLQKKLKSYKESLQSAIDGSFFYKFRKALNSIIPLKNNVK